MASGITTAFWGMTINNYDETDLAMIHHGYPDCMRELVHTLERGEEGTPHIQAWIKLQRAQRMSYVKRLFPRGHFKPLTSDAYIMNTKRYAQKLDDTAESPAVHKFHDPIPDPVTELTSVFSAVADKYGDLRHWDYQILMADIKKEEFRRVVQKPKLAKFYVSALYNNVKRTYWRAIAEHIVYRDTPEDVQSVEIPTRTHAHTHSDEKISRGGPKEDADEDEEGDSERDSRGEDEESEGYDDGDSEADETGTEGDSDDSGEESSGEED